MIYIIPMAGEGVRTQELGPYKPFININGHLIIEYCMQGLKWNLQLEDQIYFIVKKEHDRKYNVRHKLKNIIKIPHKTILIGQTDSQYETVKLGMISIAVSGYTCIVNADQYNIFQMPDRLIHDIYIPLYYETSGKSSYVKEKKGEIKKIVEKKLISHNASSGVYIFRRANNAVLCFSEFEKKHENVKEKYMSHFIQYLISKGHTACGLTTYAKIDLGNLHTIKEMRKKDIIFRRRP